ncbi:mannan endo-1,4-beta-mannosidase [Tirmania nivea]|nr:mannan endo-1,4-beta-mannosidase [Tirmania nivea]
MLAKIRLSRYSAKLTNSSAATKSPHSYLLRNYGTKILSGQQELSSITWLEQNVGKTPAIARGIVGTSINDAITFDQRNGIITFVWHWNAPSGLIDTAAALADTTNSDYLLLIRDIDAIAAELKKLQAANIPVLWRPLHEAEGGWFWLTNYHGINNLIWIWNSVDPAWYPGADVVDVVGYDSYPANGDHGPVSTQYNALVSLTGDTKLTSLTEVGVMPDPALIAVYGLCWSWWCTWSVDYVSGGSYNSLDFLKSAYTHPSVINLNGLPAN